MEEKIARWTVAVIGGSFIAPISLLLVLFHIPGIVSGGLFANVFAVKLVSFTSLYILAISLIATLPGKRFSRRFFSWSFSILFHATVLIYLGVVADFGTLILIFGAAEALMLALSMAGLWFLLQNSAREQHA